MRKKPPEINLQYEAILVKYPDVEGICRTYWEAGFEERSVWREAWLTAETILENEGVLPREGVFDFMEYVAITRDFGPENTNDRNKPTL